MTRRFHRLNLAGMFLAGTLMALSANQATAQNAVDAPLQISWEVRNRFRLFREERDFQLHVEAARNRSVLASEQALELQSDGRGWARNMVNRLCIDNQGRVSEPCTRDNVKESYLTPVDHAITVRLAGAVPVGATCAWSFDDGDGPQQSTFDCTEPVNLRVRYGKQTVATVDVTSGPLTGLTARAVVVVDENDKVVHAELVGEIKNEPNYDAALAALK